MSRSFRGGFVLSPEFFLVEYLGEEGSQIRERKRLLEESDMRHGGSALEEFWRKETAHKNDR